MRPSRMSARGASYFNKEDDSDLEEMIQRLMQMKMLAMALEVTHEH